MLLARFSICEPFQLVIIYWSAVGREASWSTRQGKAWLSRGSSILTLIVIFLLLSSHALSLSCPLCSHLSVSVFHPFSRQSDRVCPTGQPFSTHHAHHFLSSFPPVCFFHLLWPVHSPSATLHKPFYSCCCVFVLRCELDMQNCHIFRYKSNITCFCKLFLCILHNILCHSVQWGA